MFHNVFRDKKVLVTGHTGFKGAWLCTWLLKLDAKVVGVSKDIPTQPSLFEALQLADDIKDVRADIRDLEKLREIVLDEKPEFVFHLAAQAIVSVSFGDPIETFSTNVMGTVNVLESLRMLDQPCATVIITSDKCYDNVEWVWGYRETDRLGGKDIYSGSKGAAELAIRSYVSSFFSGDSQVRIGVGRAGNVIGGGDWAVDRIVGDCVRAWSMGERVNIRNPNATRPWQHVLEPLSGYLNLAMMLFEDESLHGEAFNFGPTSGQNIPVIRLLGDLAKVWGFSDPSEAFIVDEGARFEEAGLLKLNCDKALFQMGWQPNLDYEETIALVGRWYGDFYRGNRDVRQLTAEQISRYEVLARERARSWV